MSKRDRWQKAARGLQKEFPEARYTECLRLVLNGGEDAARLTLAERRKATDHDLERLTRGKA